MKKQSMLVRSGDGPWTLPEVSAYNNEAHLQDLLAANPGWIPGVDDDALTDRELSTIAGPIDLCAVGRDGSLTVVECKLSSNSEKRRMVLGQVLDYASAIWMSGFRSFVNSWSGHDLAATLGDEALAALEANIEANRIDLCLAVDVIDKDLRRLVEYLNSATRNDVHATALQLTYARHGDVELLLPTTFGSEIADAKARAAGRAKDDWDASSFLEALVDTGDREAARQLIERTVEAPGPAQRAPLWFGVGDRASVFLHPGGSESTPAAMSANRAGRLVIRGNWKAFPSIAHHPAFSPLAELLGQSHEDGAKSVPVEGIDLEALWATISACAIELDAARGNDQ